MDPRRRPTDAGDLDHGHQRQVDGDPPDHPHPAARRPARRHDDLGRDPRRRADGRPGRLDRSRRRARRSCAATTSTWPCSRPPAAAWCCAAWATSRTTRACSPTSRRTTSTSRASTPSPSWPRSKSTICRVTKPDGWVVLNADDPYVAAVARRVRARVAWFSLDPDALADHRPPPPRAAAAPTACCAAACSSGTRGPSARSSRPPTCRSRSAGLARHNLANALAAAGGARALGDDDRPGRRRACATSGPPPSTVARPHEPVPPGPADGDHRLRPQRGRHEAILDVAAAIAGGAAGPGGAGHRDHRHGRRPARRHAPRHRPDRGDQGAAGRDQGDARLPPRPRPRGHRRRDPGRHRRGRHGPRPPCPSTRPRRRRSRPSCRARAARAATNGRADAPRVVVLFCHAEREDVFALLERLGRAPGRRDDGRPRGPLAAPRGPAPPASVAVARPV